MIQPLTIRAFKVSVIGRDWATTIHAASPGQAKYQYLLGLREAWPGLTFKDLTYHSLGHPRTTERFLSVADHRGLNWRIGDIVEFQGERGALVDANDSCNFEVLFPNGRRVPIHPGDLKNLSR